MDFLSKSLWRPLIAVDLGTARTRVACGTLPLLESPSMVEGRHALRRGVVVDRDAAVNILKPLIRTATKHCFSRPRAIACVPTDADEWERTAVIDCLTEADAQAVYLVPEPFAAAVGGGDLSSPNAHMVMDIGEGITDCAVIKESTIAASRAVRVGCGDLRDAMMETILTEWGLSITTQAAEQLLQRIGVAELSEEAETLAIYGIDINHDLNILRHIPIARLRKSIQPVVNVMLGSTISLLQDISCEWGCEIIENGLLISGGGSLLRGMRERIAAETRLTVTRADDPLGAVVRGAREMLPVADLLQWWH